MSPDTSPAAQRRYDELLRRQSPRDLARQMGSLTRMVRDLALAGIRAEHPDAKPQELRVRLTVRLYGRSVAQRLFGDVPGDAL
jgi:hypothetical protein